MEAYNRMPKRKDNITIQNLGDETILYDPEKENVHVLNHTAQAIWNLCTGNNTIEDIHKSLIKLFPSTSQAELLGDLQVTINDFGKKSLIIY